MAIKAVLFDLDGTLVDSNDQHILAWKQAFAAVGAAIDRQSIHDQIGKGADMLVPALLPNLSKAEQKRLGQMQGALFASRYLEKVRPFPHAHDLLTHVVANGQLIVFASSSSKAVLDHYLRLLDASHIVTAATSADDVKQTKPAPDIFAVALKKIAPIAADEVIVVGDTPYDIDAAKKCGIAGIGLRSGGFADDVLCSAGAVMIYDGVAALLDAFEGSPLNAEPLSRD